MDVTITTGLLLLVGGVGLFGGVLSGVLGIGGGILLAPLLLYVPRTVGHPALTMQVVSGLTIVQSLFAASAGAFSHHGRGATDVPLALWLGGTMLLASFAGAWQSASVGSDVLLALFAVLATAAALLMLLPRPEADEERYLAPGSFSRAREVGLGLVVGFTGGMVGQSGAFMVVPGMIHVLRVPVRTAVGTTLAVVFLAALAGTAGKLAAGQIVWPLAATLAVPAVIGARIGVRWSYRIAPATVRRVLAGIITIAAARIWYDVVSGL